MSRISKVAVFLPNPVVVTIMVPVMRTVVIIAAGGTAIFPPGYPGFFKLPVRMVLGAATRGADKVAVVFVTLVGGSPVKLGV